MNHEFGSNMDQDMFSPPDMNLWLASVLENYDEVSVLRHFLGFPIFGAPATLHNAAIVCLDIEWWQNEPHPTTEIGISEIMATGQAPTALAENILSSIQVAHARVMPYAHLKNSFKGAGDPGVFEFGTTKFVTEEEAKAVLINTFMRPSCSGDGSLQPIILVGHAVENGFDHLERAFDIDLRQCSTIVKVIDTQAMAVTASIKGHAGRIISLKHLLEHFSMDVKNLHSAGTDAACTLVVAILITLKDVLYPPGSRDKLPATVRGRNIQDILYHMMALGKSYPPPPWGRIRFCTRCDRENHFSKDCRAIVSCNICHKSGIVRLYNSRKTHATSKCMFNYLPLPNSIAKKDFEVDGSSPQLPQVLLPGQYDEDRMEE